MKYIMGEIVKRKKFEEYYSALEKYHQEHGNIDVPINYQTEKGLKLGRWLMLQRQSYNGKKDRHIKKDKIQKLNDLGVKWNVREENWDEYYAALEKYYQEHGNIDVPTNYKTEEGLKLGQWLSVQRCAYNGKEKYSITADRVLLLNDLGMKWNIHEENWNEHYKALKKYYQEHGNIDIPQIYETDEEINLGQWLSKQRLDYRRNDIQSNHIKLLNNLFIDWSPKETKKLNQEITNLNISDYQNILLLRLNHILNDIKNEGINEIVDSKSQEEMVSILIKRIWR